MNIALTADAWRRKLGAEMAEEMAVLEARPDLREADDAESLAEFGRLVFEARRANGRRWSLFDLLHQPKPKPKK